MRIAVIPARSGSKRIPRKNIKPFCGKPMIAWSIEAALESWCFEQVVVSTDDKEIAAVAKRHGATIPFMRPGSLADDHTGITPVIAHAIEWFQQQGVDLDFVCCIYANAPLIRASDIRSGLNLIMETRSDYSLAVTSFPYPIRRALMINKAGQVEMFHPEHFKTRSQDLEEAYHDAGQFYWGSSTAWVENKPFFSNAVPLIIPRHRVQDIDTQEDLKRAELIFQVLKQRGQEH